MNIMKRFYYIITLLILAIMPATLTSCDTDDPWYGYPDEPYYPDNGGNGGNQNNVSRDVAMAQTLNGAWTGIVENTYTDDFGKRVTTQCYVDLSFTQYENTSNRGNGFEIDYMLAYDENGRPIYDAKGNPVYDESDPIAFTWNINPRTYQINIEYIKSKMTFAINTNQNFFLGWDKNDRKDYLQATMQGVNNDEIAVFDCERVTRSMSPSQTRSTTTYNAQQLSFGTSVKHLKSDVPMALRKR